MGVQVVYCTDENLVKKPGFYEVDNDGQINPKKFVGESLESDNVVNLEAHGSAKSKAE